jgi:hypothetical protein
MVVMIPARAAAVMLLLIPPFAASAKVVEIGVYGDWRPYTDGAVCYMGSEPKKAEGKYKARDQPYVFVSHRPKAKSLGVIEVGAGYTYKLGSEAGVAIGEKSFLLFADGNTAWARNAKTDRALVAAMKGGKAMVIKGTSSRGTLTTDTYSLAGFTAAFAAIGKACKVK